MFLIFILLLCVRGRLRPRSGEYGVGGVGKYPGMLLSTPVLFSVQRDTGVELMRCPLFGGIFLFLDSASKDGVIYRFLQMAYFTLTPPKAQHLCGCFVEQGCRRAETRGCYHHPLATVPRFGSPRSRETWLWRPEPPGLQP